MEKSHKCPYYNDDCPKCCKPTLPQDVGERFDKILRDIYIDGLLDGREKLNSHIRAGDIRKGMHTTGTAVLFKKFNQVLASELSKQKEEMVEKIDTLVQIIKDIKGYSPDGEIGTLCDQALQDITNLIKQ